MILEDVMMRSEIEQVLARYSHAVDHGDLDLALQSYWPEAVDRHGDRWNGNGQEYMRDLLGRFSEMTEGVQGLTACMHHISTTVIERCGSHDARVQAYFTAYIPHRHDATERLGLMLGRYLDHFQERDGEWRILDRTVVSDFTRDDVGEGMMAVASWQEGGFVPGGYGDSDPGVSFLTQK